MDRQRSKPPLAPRAARALLKGAAMLVVGCAAFAGLVRLTMLWLEADVAPVAANTDAGPQPVRAEPRRRELTIEVPQGFELANIALALTEFAERRPHTIFRRGAYYRDVMAHFGPHRSHPLVARLNERLRGEREWYGFFGFRENGVSFALRDGVLARTSGYPPRIWGRNVFAEDSALVADFARRAGFAAFHARHRDFYAARVAAYRAQVPLPAMWDWLEARFPARYDRYRIVFSPLVYGSHSTQRFDDGGVRETIMFVAGPDVPADTLDPALRAAHSARIVFTEIDHNYVNPVTDRYRARVDSAFADVRAWNHDTQAGMYDTPVATFNEYMTWGVFSLWARDTYPPAIFAAIQRDVVQQMEGPRGFVRFGAFNRALLDAYAAQGDRVDIDALYESMLAWAASSRAQGAQRP